MMLQADHNNHLFYMYVHVVLVFFNRIVFDKFSVTKTDLQAEYSSDFSPFFLSSLF